jgi:hypothetical protein
VFLEKLGVAHLVKQFPYFVESVSPLPRPQEPSQIPILSQINPVYNSPFDSFKVSLNIILLSRVCPRELCNHLSSAPHGPHALPAWLILFDSITLAVQIVQLFNWQLSPTSYFFGTVGPCPVLNTLFSNTLKCLLPLWQETNCHTNTEQQAKFLNLHILDFMTADSRRKDKFV